ncbi:hypothetical protein Tco_0281516 [Tanacetum coccineum]
MASHRSKSLYAIKECMTCGSLYTRECCSIGSLENKILVPVPDSSPCCAKCGTPVDGPYCRGCALLRKEFEEDLLTNCVENGIYQDFQDTFETSDGNTNVVNAPREPFVVNQNPGVKFSQNPPQIDHNCCYECGDSLDGIFCRQCICKSCGKGAHYGYNCPPEDPIISTPVPCKQIINEILQTLPSLDPSCNSFAYDPNPNSFDNSQYFSYQPPQPQFETYLCELCGNNAHYGYDCPPQFPFVYEQEPCYNQNFNDNYSQSYSQQYLCCANCGGPHETFQCQPMNEDYYEQNSCYYPNSSGFDHPQPPQDSVDCQEALDKILEELEELKRDQRMLKELKKQIAEEQTAKENMSIEEMRHEQQLVDYKIKEITNNLEIKRFRGEKIDEEYERICEITIRKLEQDFNEWGSKVRKKEQAYEEEQYSAARRRMLSIPFVDEDDYIPLGDIIAQYSTFKAITPDLPIEEPDNSLIMEDEHLHIIPETESDEFIKSSVENLVQNPSESAYLSDCESECDVPIDDDSPESHFMTFSNPLFDSNDDFSSDDESLSEEEIQKDEFKYFSNPLYDLDDEIITNEKILPNQKDLDVVIPIPSGIDKRCFNAESDPLESLLNRDYPIDSTKIDSIFDEFSLPRPLEESKSEYSDATIESLSPSPIPVKDSDPFMEEIDILLASDDSTPPGVESDYDSEGDILLLKELLNDDFIPLAEYHHFTFNIEPDTAVKNNFDELNEDECFDPGGGENVVFLNVEKDDSFTFTIRTFLPFVTYPEVSSLLSSTKNVDTIFDPDIST